MNFLYYQSITSVLFQDGSCHNCYPLLPVFGQYLLSLANLSLSLANIFHFHLSSISWNLFLPVLLFAPNIPSVVSMRKHLLIQWLIQFLTFITCIIVLCVLPYWDLSSVFLHSSTFHVKICHPPVIIYLKDLFSFLLFFLSIHVFVP